jgi:hypothetical protein
MEKRIKGSSGEMAVNCVNYPLSEYLPNIPFTILKRGKEKFSKEK